MIDEMLDSMIDPAIVQDDYQEELQLQNKFVFWVNARN